MNYYNVYSDGTVVDFPSKEEADARPAFWKASYPTQTRVTRYGCYDELTYWQLETERMKIYDLYQDLKDGNRDVVTRLWTEYSRFWWEHRNVVRET